MMVFLALVPCWSCRKLVGSACPAGGVESAIEQGETKRDRRELGLVRVPKAFVLVCKAAQPRFSKKFSKKTWRGRASIVLHEF